MIKTLDKYILKELIPSFFLALLIFTFLLLIDKIFDLMELIVGKGVPFFFVLKLLLFILPAFLVLTIPMSVLVSVLICFGRLSSDREIVALKSSGISIYRLLKPVIIFALIAWVATSFIMIELLPMSNYSFKQLIFNLVRQKFSVGVKEKIFSDTFGNFIIYVNEISPTQIGLGGIFISDERNPSEPRIIVAKEGRLINDEQNRRLTFRLLNGSTHEIIGKGYMKYRKVVFTIYDLNLTIDSPLMSEAEAPKGDREMFLDELIKNANEAKKSGVVHYPYLVEYYKKFSIPFACLIFATIGLPLGIKSRHSGKSAGVIISLFIILVYYLFLTAGESLGDKGKISPFLSMWAPNILFGILAILLLRATARETSMVFLDRLLSPIIWIKTWRKSSTGVMIVQPESIPAQKSLKFQIPQKKVKYVKKKVRPRSKHIIDKYLFREFFKLFFSGVSFVITIFIVVDLFQNIDTFTKYQASFNDILDHYIYRTPAALYQGLPLIVLLSTILLFVILSRSNELTALKNSGMSIYRTSLPIVILAFLITFAAVIFQETLLPYLNQQGEETDKIKIKKQQLQHLQKQHRIWFRSSEGRFFHIELFDPLNYQMSNVTIYELNDNFDVNRRIDSKDVRWIDGMWRFEKGVVREFNKSSADMATPFNIKYIQLRETFKDFQKIQKAPEVMSFFELKSYINKLQEGGHTVSKYLVDLYSKLSFPFVNIIMVLVGIPFALKSPRSGKVIGIGISILIAIIYWIIHSAALSLARMGILPPVLAAWTSNIIMGGLGVYLLINTRT